MPVWLEAALWGLVGGSALVLGAGIAELWRLPPRLIAAVMAFGSGVLISALSFELIEEAMRVGGWGTLSIGFLGGAAVYTAANIAVTRRGAAHRKRSGHVTDESQAGGGSGLAIAIGALLDGVPESVVIGMSLAGGSAVNLVTVAAVFLSNLPEGLSSAAGMRRAGRSRRYVFGVWGAIAAASGVAALVGNLALADAGPWAIALANAVAAGAILAMLADTMIPEAFEQAHEAAGLVTAFGFWVSFMLSSLGGG